MFWRLFACFNSVSFSSTLEQGCDDPPRPEDWPNGRAALAPLLDPTTRNMAQACSGYRYLARQHGLHLDFYVEDCPECEGE